MPRSWFDSFLLQGTVSTSGTPPTGATTNGNGRIADTGGVVGAQQIELQESAGGTATVNIEGSFDGLTWYAAGYQQVDGVGVPTRAVAAISVLANSSHVYQVLDPYPQLRARLSAVAAGATVRALLYIVGG